MQVSLYVKPFGFVLHPITISGRSTFFGPKKRVVIVSGKADRGGGSDSYAPQT